MKLATTYSYSRRASRLPLVVRVDVWIGPSCAVCPTATYSNNGRAPARSLIRTAGAAASSWPLESRYVPAQATPSPPSPLA